MQGTATDEQELAKALEGITVPSVAPTPPPTTDSNVHNSGVQPIVPSNSPVAPATTTDSSEKTNLQTNIPVNKDQKTIQPITATDSKSDTASSDSTTSDKTTSPDPPLPPVDSTNNVTEDANSAATDDGPLNSIKNEALNELRPLVDKLDVKAEDKFDTYLLLIRSTDDMNLIAPAHEAAKAIEDEARRAQALLDIIKEIDYLSHKNDKE